MNMGEWLEADAKALRRGQLRWAQNHEPCSRGDRAFEFTWEALMAWPTELPITHRDLNCIRNECEYVAQSIRLREYADE